VLVIQGQELTDARLREVRELVAAHPEWSRYRLSTALAELWDWRAAGGQLKDMAARTLMLKLQARGLLTLPSARGRQPRRGAGSEQPTLWDTETGLGDGETLRSLEPIRCVPVRSGMAEHSRVEGYLARRHYLGYKGHVGENLAYLASDAQGRDLGCLLFGAAAWRTHPRDELIGWDDATRAKRLSYITNNTRFLVLARVPHLASCLLGTVTRRLRRDWEEKYGHPVFLVETYVDRDRFRGTCYRAANWQLIGQTRGRSRQDRFSKLRVPVKDIYVYPLTPRFRDRLRASA